MMGALLADGFHKAFIGFGRQASNWVAVYDYDKCVGVLMARDKMSEEEAIEFMEYNVVGAYVGERTPIFVDKSIKEEDID